MQRINIISKDVYDPRIKIKIASTHEELLAAYQLLYQAYVDAGLMDENEFKIRCNLYTFLPTTVTIIACIDKEVVGTVAVIRDSSFGIPSDKEFLEQNERLRINDGVIAEVSALAVKKQYRFSDHRVSYLLMKFVFKFSMQYFKCTHLAAVAHPKTELFYKSYFLFERNGPVIRYQFVKGALGVHMSTDLRPEAQRKFIKQRYNCFSRFIYEPDSLCQFPVFKDGQVVIPVMTQKKFSDFMQLAGLKISNFKHNEMMALMVLYKPHIQRESQNTILKNMREFRYPVEKSAILHLEDSEVIIHVKNISLTGAFIQTHMSQFKQDQNISITLQMNAKLYRLNGKVVWINNFKKSSHLPIGIGIEFQQNFTELSQEVQGWSIAS